MRTGGMTIAGGNPVRQQLLQAAQGIDAKGANTVARPFSLPSVNHRYFLLMEEFIKLPFEIFIPASFDRY